MYVQGEEEEGREKIRMSDCVSVSVYGSMRECIFAVSMKVEAFVCVCVCLCVF